MCPWYDPGYISTDPASYSQSAQKIFRIYFRKHFRNISKPEIAKCFACSQDLSKDCATINLLMLILRNISFEPVSSSNKPETSPF